MMKNYIFILGLISLVSFTSCNKTNSLSKRLSGETWKVTSLLIDGEIEEEDHLPEFTFDECDIYDEVCMAEWHIEDEHAEFAWQFDEKGTIFTISNQTTAEHDHDHEEEEEEHEEELVEPVDQCQDLSGTYDVDEMDNKVMKISSNATIGHDGVMVVIELERV
jgi:hypothetical protein